MSTPSQTSHPLWGGIAPFLAAGTWSNLPAERQSKRARSVSFFLGFPAFAEEIRANPLPGSKHAAGAGREAAAPRENAACFHQGSLGHRWRHGAALVFRWRPQFGAAGSSPAQLSQRPEAACEHVGGGSQGCREALGDTPGAAGGQPAWGLPWGPLERQREPARAKSCWLCSYFLLALGELLGLVWGHGQISQSTSCLGWDICSPGGMEPSSSSPSTFSCGPC